MNGILPVFLWEVVVPPFFVSKPVDFQGGYSGGYSKWIFTLGVTGYSKVGFGDANNWVGFNTRFPEMELKKYALHPTHKTTRFSPYIPVQSRVIGISGSHP